MQSEQQNNPTEAAQNDHGRGGGRGGYIGHGGGEGGFGQDRGPVICYNC